MRNRQMLLLRSTLAVTALAVWGTRLEVARADAPPPGPGAFSIAILPDTQSYLGGGPATNAIFAEQTQWIVDHKESYTALVNAPGSTSFRVAARSAAGVAGKVAFEVGEETRLRRQLSEVYSFRALNTSFQSCWGGRRRWIEG